MKNIILILLFGVLLAIVPLTGVAQQVYKIDFWGKPVFSDTLPNDKVSIYFNLKDNNNERLVHDYFSIKNKNIKIDESIERPLGKENTSLRYVDGSFKNLKAGKQGKDGARTLSGDITVSILVDRSGSMNKDKIDIVNNVIADLLDKLPDGCVFLSWFGNDISPSRPIRKSDFEKNKINYTKKKENTALYNAIYTKLLEFDSAAVIPNQRDEISYVRNPQIYLRKTSQNYLFVLTDGKNDVDKIPNYKKKDFFNVDSLTLFRALKKYSGSENSPKVNVYLFGIKDENNDKYYDEKIMKRICYFNGNPDKYFRGGKDKLPDFFNRAIDLLHPDYMLKVQYKTGQRFTGYPRTVTMTIHFNDGKTARGSYTFVKGSKTNPYIVNPPSIYEVYLKGLIIGLIFLILVVILIQIIFPFTKSSYFQTRYVKKYKKGLHPDKDVENVFCSWCNEEIKEGEKVVIRCSHWSHWSCWKERGRQCPNYPDMCSVGKQDYFDINDPFAKDDNDSLVKRNKRRFMKWVVSGIVAGILSWLSYQLLLQFGLFDNLIKVFVPEDTPDYSVYIEKYSPLLLMGSVMGFYLSGFFLYQEEYRKITVKIALVLLLRSIIGSVIGFASFFLGSLILIYLKIYQTSMIDVIPWMMFGPVFGYYLSVKTTLSSYHGIMGGLFSILFSFVFLYLINMYNEDYLLVLSQVIYGSGLGVSISTIRQMSEKYFLILTNANLKNNSFPLHKWISKIGDYGTFTIGKGKSCVLKMDWEQNGNVSEDVHAVIYLEKSKLEYPVISIRDTENKTYLNETVLMKPEKEYVLRHGSTFKIGNTVFKYEEKHN